MREQAMDDRHAPAEASRWWWAAAVAVVALATFLPTAWFGFVNWDDPDLILVNPRVTEASAAALFATPGTAYLPARDLAWNLTYRLAGPGAAPFHLLNVVCHAAASGLFCLVAIELCGRRAAWVGGLAGLAFAVHPLHVEPVAWASGVKDPLSAVFLLWALLLYVGAVATEERGWRLLRLGMALGLFWYATLAKASALVLPVLMLLYAASLAPKRRRALGLALPFVALAGLMAWVTYDVAAASGAVKVRTAAPGRVALTTVTVVGGYLQRLLVPVGLSPRYPAAGSPRPELVAVTLYVLLLVQTARRHRRAFFALAWVGAALLPYLNIVRTSTQQADRYLYLAVGGWGLCLGLAAEAAVGGGKTVLGGRWTVLAARRRQISLGLCLALVAGYAVLSVRQCRVWRSSEALWERALAVAPEDALAHYMLGDAVSEREPLRAARHFRRAADAHLEAAADHLLGAGEAREQGDEALADRHTALVLEHERLAADALAYLGTVVKQLEAEPGVLAELGGAYQLHQQALRFSRGQPRFHYLVAQDLIEAGRYRDALPHYEAAAAGPAWLRQQVVADLRQLRNELREQAKAEDAAALADLLRRIGRPSGNE